MKKFAKLLCSMILFFTYANQVYATSIEIELSDGMKKWGLMGVGVVLVLIVLYIGYKMDNPGFDESKYKKTMTQQEKNKKEEKQDSIVEDIYKTATEEDVPYELEKNEKYETEKIDLSEINENTEYSEDEEESLFLSVSKVKGYDTFEDDLEEYNKTESNQNIEIENNQEKVFEDMKSFDSTMVFNTDIFGNKEVETEDEEIKETEEETDNTEELEDSDESSEIDEFNLSSKIDELDDYVEESTSSSNDIFGNLPNIMNLENQEVDMDNEINELDEDVEIERVGETEYVSPIMLETDFGGFTVKENPSTSKEEEKTLSLVKRFTRKKTNKLEKDEVLEVKEESETSKLETDGVDYSFLAQMEENLISSKNKRLGTEEKVEEPVKKSTKKVTTTKKSSSKTAEETTKTKKAASKKTEEKESKKKSTDTKKTTTKKTTAKKSTTKKAEVKEKPAKTTKAKKETAKTAEKATKTKKTTKEK